MKRSENYITKQGKAVFEYLASQNGEYVTAAQIEEHFQNSGNVSRSTIYRRLEKLVREGHVFKYTFEGISGACFRYAEQKKNEPHFCRLKCEKCGVIFNIECVEVERISCHIQESHSFRVNVSKTVFYGKCEECLQKHTLY